MEILDAMGWLNGATLLIVLILAALVALLGGLLANRFDRRNDHGPE